MSEVTLRPARDTDWSRIRSWLAEPDIQRWWGPSAASEAEVITALGSEHAIARMIQVDGADVGYGHAVDASLWGDELPSDLEPGTWDLDIFIATREHRGKGIGSQFLDRAHGVARDQGLPELSLLVFEENQGACSLYERNGYTVIDRRAIVPHPLIHCQGDVLLMTCPVA